MNLRAGLAIVALILTTAAQNLSSQSAPATAPGERNYTLEATMLGYRGVGGRHRRRSQSDALGADRRDRSHHHRQRRADGARHHARETNVKSAQILDKGASTSITFKAKASDTYFCSVPGHRAAGMEGRIDVSDSRQRSPT